MVSVRYGDHFRYCIQVDSSVVNQEELDYFVGQIEQQVEELLSETAQLRRKISTESSVFDHEKANKQVQLSTQVVKSKENVTDSFENEDKGSLLENCINNNVITGEENAYNLGRSIISKNYSFIFKLKDSFEQIKQGIRKMKEE